MRLQRSFRVLALVIVLLVLVVPHLGATGNAYINSAQCDGSGAGDWNVAWNIAWVALFAALAMF